ncbi:neutral zinc metallopeptidase [Pedobacter sp. P351]|uniref:KPN_02809 family neutral zinc metallopeptidase n=1 Tax=Pedobacter superstes TaxID=3133441 RepID=UPI0030AB0D72
MKWLGRRGSGNIEDRRSGGGGLAIGGGVTAVIAVIFSLLTGQNPMELLGMFQGGGSGTQQEAPLDTEVNQDKKGHFVSVVLADTEDVWNKLFSESGSDYKEPTLVLFSGAVHSACGSASSATGPFYCPGDEKVYIDLTFYDELQNKFGAPGDFAMAYVVAHEVGHHIQNILGTSSKLDEARGRVSQEEYNQLSVKLELQADFLAGVWAHHAQRMKSILEEGDIEEALNAANAIGDDRLQQQSQGRVVPDAFTHGTSAQRMRWFKKGYETGDINQGDTFNSPNL